MIQLRVERSCRMFEATLVAKSVTCTTHASTHPNIHFMIKNKVSSFSRNYDNLQVSSDVLLRCFEHVVTSCTLIGSPGVNLNVVNAIAAVFIATGQDAASAAESTSAQLNVCLASPEQVARYCEEGADLLPRGLLRVQFVCALCAVVAHSEMFCLQS